MISGGNWWRANEMVMRHLTRQSNTRYRSRDKALLCPSQLQQTRFNFLLREPRSHFRLSVTESLKWTMASGARRKRRPPGEPTKVVRLPLPVATLARRLAARIFEQATRWRGVGWGCPTRRH